MILARPKRFLDVGGNRLTRDQGVADEYREENGPDAEGLDQPPEQEQQADE